MKKVGYTLLICLGVFIALCIGGVSYAFFRANVTGNNTATLNKMNAGTMSATFTDNSSEVRGDKWIPGDTIVKTFKVKSTGSLDANYSIKLVDLTNTFIDKNDLVFTLESSDGGMNIAETVLPSEDGVIASGITLATPNEHNYTLRVTFVNKDEPQSDNYGAGFTFKIRVE